MTPTREPAIEPELVDRIVDYLRRMSMAIKSIGSGVTLEHWDELHDIVDQLPKKYDPDLFEAREIAAVRAQGARIATLNGDWDNSIFVQNALDGIKRGRTLEREGK